MKAAALILYLMIGSGFTGAFSPNHPDYDVGSFIVDVALWPFAAGAILGHQFPVEKQTCVEVGE